LLAAVLAPPQAGLDLLDLGAQCSFNLFVLLIAARLVTTVSWASLTSSLMSHQLAIIAEPGGCAQRLLPLACHLSFLTECRGLIEASAGRSIRSKVEHDLGLTLWRPMYRHCGSPCVRRQCGGPVCSRGRR
jgi:hypothetical protein